jgi:hypothetical protein
MAIEWYSEAKAETAFEDTLTQWATMYGYKGCYSPEQTYEAMRKTKFWARNSPTAMALVRFVEDSSKKIVVVGMKGGYQCFDSTAGADKNLQVIFIDLDGQLTVNVRTPHNIHLDPNLCTANVVPLNNRVALLHEYGHAKQWIERPTLFDNQKAAAGATMPRWGGGQVDARLQKATFAGDIRNLAAAKLAGKPGGATLSTFREDRVLPDGSTVTVRRSVRERGTVPSAEELKEFKPPVWGPAIEMDNMARHEWPICDELGLPRRANYRDINCTSDSAPSVTSMIRRKVAAVLAQEQAREEAKRLEAERQKKARTAVTACTHPGCQLTFPSRLLMNQHFSAAHV